MATVTVRLIRSFEYRNIKPVVFTNVDLDQSTAQFTRFINDEVKIRPGLPPPFKTHSYDVLKIQHKAHGAKTSDPVINTENDDDLILKEHLSLGENGVEHETELSYFNGEDYTKYKTNPTLKW